MRAVLRTWIGRLSKAARHGRKPRLPPGAKSTLAGCNAREVQRNATMCGTHLLLEVAGAQRYLILLHAARVPRPLGRHVVLPPARPVLVVFEVVGYELPMTSIGG